MQNVKGSEAPEGNDTPAPSGDRDAVYQAVAEDLALLIERIQASLTMIESAVATEASTALQEMATNVVVLDDVTPRYLKAGAALRACGAGLGVALHFLREPMGSGPDMHASAGDHLSSRGADRPARSAIN